MSSTSKCEIWKERVADYRSSNLKAQEWCDENKLSIKTLYYWIHRFNKESITNSNPKSEFVPIAIPGIAIQPTASIVIRFGNIAIDVSDGCHPDTLRNVMEALGAYA